MERYISQVVTYHISRLVITSSREIFHRGQMLPISTKPYKEGDLSGVSFLLGSVKLHPSKYYEERVHTKIRSIVHNIRYFPAYFDVSSSVCSQSFSFAPGGDHRFLSPISSPCLSKRLAEPAFAAYTPCHMYSPQSSGEIPTIRASPSVSGARTRPAQWEPARFFASGVATMPGAVWMNDRLGYFSAKD